MMFTDRGGVFKRNVTNTDRVQTTGNVGGAGLAMTGINKIDTQ